MSSALTGYAVLNAADPLVADFAELCDGEVIFFTADPSCLLSLAEHFCRRQAGGVTVADGRIILRTGVTKSASAASVTTAADRQGQEGGRHRQRAGCRRRWLGAGLTQEVISTGVATFGLDLLNRKPCCRFRPRTAVRPCRNNKETSRHGRFPHSRPARPQPVEPPHRHPGHRHLRDGAETAIADLPGFEAAARALPELGDLIPPDHLDTVSVAHA